MAKFQILNPAEQRLFEQPPIFTSSERKKYLRLTEATKVMLNKLRHPNTRLYCFVALGYFKATKRFYARQFHKIDLLYAAKQLGIDDISSLEYKQESFLRHKKLILEHVGFEAYSKKGAKKICSEIEAMVRSQKRPRLIFEHIVESFVQQRLEVPTYYRLHSLIAKEVQQHKAKLLTLIQKTLNQQAKQFLEELIRNNESEGDVAFRYPVTSLKRFSQSVQPSKIKGNVESVKLLKNHYETLEELLDVLALPHEGLRYYAQSVINSKIFQITRRSKEDVYLHLIAFIAHQFYRGQDVLIDALLKTTQTMVNTIHREHKEKVYEHRREYRRSVQRLVTVVQKGLRTPLDSIESITANEQLSDQAKLKQIEELFDLIASERSEAVVELDLLDDETQKLTEDAEYYDLLEKKSRKLQNRVAGIVKFLEFKGKDQALLSAIKHFQDKDGNVTHTAPSAFLKEEQRNVLFDSEGNFRISLYKSFLFLDVAAKLKAGRLHLKHSYKYRALDAYLIPSEKWQADKATYLRKANMTAFAESQPILDSLTEQLGDNYKQTNQEILEENNPHIKLKKKDAFVLSTPKADTIEAAPLNSLFPKGHYISLLEVLHTINKQCSFLDSFEHWQQQARTKRPTDKTFFAGIMGYGCNIGIDKLVSISKSIQTSVLENTTNWYFSLDNLQSANNKILALMDTMTVADLYRRDAEQLHTSSDGQKFEVATESLLASHSFKYFGQSQGVSLYSFVDERNLAFYSTVISANEREVAYVIDGLMHNDVVQSDIHSTDTHGYSEALFGVTHLLGFYFAPRIKGFAKQRMYSFEKKLHYKALGYSLLPDAYIDSALITKHWDDILRFVTTIKLKEATASQLFKRLNSYSKQHPLYKALKEFGKIIKSLFMLKYISDVTLRQAIEKQLNKGELSNRLNKAISFGGNQQLAFVDKETLDIADACRRLIKNAVLCWNYLYLSKQLSQAEPEQQTAIIQSIKAGSPVAWRHINMHGEYDFSDEKLVDSVGLTSPNLIDLNHLDIWDIENQAISLEIG